MTRVFGSGRYANVVSTLALVLALGGTAYAANTVRSKDIVDGQVKAADLGKNAVTTTKVRDGSLLAADFGAGQLPAGPQGQQGAQGPQGQQGPPGPSTGQAGGDLTGSYPDPTIAPNALGSAEVVDGALRLRDLAVWDQAYQVAPFTVAANSCHWLDYGTRPTAQIGDIALVGAPTYLAPEGIFMNASLYSDGSGGVAAGIDVCNRTGSSITVPYPFTPRIYGLRVN